MWSTTSIPSIGAAATVTSEPVPAVVGIANSGSIGLPTLSMPSEKSQAMTSMPAQVGSVSPGNQETHWPVVRVGVCVSHFASHTLPTLSVSKWMTMKAETVSVIP